jgi:hypothetical protein
MKRRIASLLCALLFLPFLAPAAEQARLPYEMIYQIQQKAAALSQTYTNLHIYIRVNSTLPAVKNSDLSLYIDSKTGRIPVALDPDGRFAVPMLQTLLDEKASIVVNQPKGTMQFGWYVGLILESVPTNGIHYSDMMRPLKNVEAIRAEMLPGSTALSIRGMKFIYPKDKDATVTIRAKSGDRVFKTDPAHTLVIPWEPALQQENPQLSIPIPPEKIDVSESDQK